MWGKQARVDELFDLDDIAAGYITRQRWTDDEPWIFGPRDAHPALVDRDLWNDVAARIASRSVKSRPDTGSLARAPRPTSCGDADAAVAGRRLYPTTPGAGSNRRLCKGSSSPA